MSNRATHRVFAYVDGFNLYFGLRAAKLDQFRWLDIARLAQNLLLPTQHLEKVHYFTALVRGPNKDKRRRQRDWIDAMQSRELVTVTYGRYLKKDGECHQCGNRWDRWEEKMTDVNIATQLVVDAFHDRFDTALLLSGDSDLANAVRVVQEETGKRVVAAFPPKRESYDLKQVCDASFRINRTVIGKSLLPDTVTLGGGRTVTRPSNWF